MVLLVSLLFEIFLAKGKRFWLQIQNQTKNASFRPIYSFWLYEAKSITQIKVMFELQAKVMNSLIFTMAANLSRYRYVSEVLEYFTSKGAEILFIVDKEY